MIYIGIIYIYRWRDIFKRIYGQNGEDDSLKKGEKRLMIWLPHLSGFIWNWFRFIERTVWTDGIRFMENEYFVKHQNLVSSMSDKYRNVYYMYIYVCI